MAALPHVALESRVEQPITALEGPGGVLETCGPATGPQPCAEPEEP